MTTEKIMRRICWITLASASLALAACSNTEADHGNAASHDQMTQGHANMAMPEPGDSDATRAYKASMSDMMSDAPAYTGDADVDFMQQMRVHHGAAIAMSEAVLEHGSDDTTRSLANAIIREQRREIAEIDAWLAARKS